MDREVDAKSRLQKTAETVNRYTAARAALLFNIFDIPRLLTLYSARRHLLIDGCAFPGVKAHWADAWWVVSVSQPDARYELVQITPARLGKAHLDRKPQTCSCLRTTMVHHTTFD